MTTVENLPSVCPHCSEHLECCSSLYEDALPEPGSVTLCACCLKWCFFTTGLRLRAPLPGELEGLPEEHRAMLREIEEAARRLRAVKGSLS